MPAAKGSVRRRGGAHYAYGSKAVALLLAALLFLCFSRRVYAQGGAAEEYQVKAAFLFHFAEFVNWPAEAFADGAAPVTYCTLGEDPFQGALDQSLHGKMVGAHPLRVEHLKQTQGIQDCRVLFVGANEKKRLSAALAGIKGNPILTVGESEHFVQDGGMIGFCMDGNKVRFEVNLDAAGQSRLKISARLLALAKTVIGKQGGA
jgi:hypothetical protein